MKFDEKWRTPIIWVAVAGTAIAGSVGTRPLTASDQVPVAEQVVVAEAATSRPVRLVDKTMETATLRDAVRAFATAREKGWQRARTGTVASGATATVVVAAGARIRTRPVTGTVVGLISRGDWYWVQCQRRAGDGRVWGYGHNNGRWGWVRDDLWDVIYSTAPGASAPRPIPWC